MLLLKVCFSSPEVFFFFYWYGLYLLLPFLYIYMQRIFKRVKLKYQPGNRGVHGRGGQANAYPSPTQLQASRLESGWAEAFFTLARPLSQLGSDFLLLFSFFLVNSYSTKGKIYTDRTRLRTFYHFIQARSIY